MEITAIEASMDVSIDNISTITFDYEHWIDRAKSASLLVIHTLLRPLHPSEPLKRDDTIYLGKLSGEGKLAKHKTCLGWDINTYSLRVLIPEEKQTAWTNDTK